MSSFLQKIKAVGQQLANMSSDTTSVTSQAEPSFSRFPELPTEIRLKIWNYASREPRRIKITDNQFRVPNPSTLFVNFESRQQALKVFRLLFDGKDLVGGTQHTYFNPEVDTIWFSDITQFTFPLDPQIVGPPVQFARVAPQEECDSVKFIEVEESYGDWQYTAVNFRFLDKVTVRCHGPAESAGDLARHCAKEFYSTKLDAKCCTKIPELIIKCVE